MRAAVFVAVVICKLGLVRSQCWDKSDKANDCNVFVLESTRDRCNDYTSWEAVNCDRACCDLLNSNSASGSTGNSWNSGSSSSARCTGNSFDKDTSGQCKTWVEATPNDCQDSTSYVYDFCEKTCCDYRPSSVQFSSSVRDDRRDWPGSRSNFVDSRAPPPSYCMQQHDTGSCSDGDNWDNSEWRYYHCPFCLKCKKFRFGRCGGNQNNFRTMEECQQTCERKGTNAYSRMIQSQMGNTNGRCMERPGDLRSDCAGFVERTPQKCLERTWIAENCQRACCLKGY